ncbi:MAG: hypothetical protein WDA74_06160 [Spirochaetota bacterium]
MNKKNDNAAEEIILDKIKKVFTSKGRYSWSIDLKRKYFYKLQKQNQLKSTDLPLSTYENEISKIIETIQNFDKDYKVFKEFHERYESYGRKIVELFKIEKFTDEEKEYIIKSLSNKVYDLSDKDQWTPLKIEKAEDGSGVTIKLGKSAFQTIRAPLERSDLDLGVWEKIEEKAIEKLSAGDKLIGIQAKMLAPKRSIIKIHINLSKHKLEVSSDNFQVDQTGNRLKDETVRLERKAAVKQVAEMLGKDKELQKITKAFESESNKIFSENTFNELHKTNEDEFLIIHILERYDRPDESITELSEDLISKLKNQKINDIIKKVSEYFDQNGSLKGFFEKHYEHHSSRATYISLLEKDKSAVRTAYSAYAIIIRNGELYEQYKSYDNKLKDKVVEYIQFDYDYSEKILEVKDSTYSKYVYETLIQKIYELSDRKN